MQSPLPSIFELRRALEQQGVALPAGPVRVDAYGDSESLSNELLALIRSGRKRAGTGLLWLHEHLNEPIAQAGEIEIVINYAGVPSVITRTVSSKVIPFNEVTAKYAAIEGEGDGSLQHWRQAHWAYFSRECQRIGRISNQSMPVVCSIFEILHVLPQRADA